MFYVKEKFKNLRVGDFLLKINYMYKKFEKLKVIGKNFYYFYFLKKEMIK